MTDPLWCEAMASEINTLGQNKTWILEPLPDGMTVVGCMWLLNVKCLADGSLDKYKAKLVAPGNTQIYGLNYFETFAPVAKMTIVRILIVIAV